MIFVCHSAVDLELPTPTTLDLDPRALVSPKALGCLATGPACSASPWALRASHRSAAWRALIWCIGGDARTHAYMTQASSGPFLHFYFF